MKRAPAPKPISLSWWDRLLIGVAPTWGLRRIRARAAAYAYEAASGGRRTDGWHRNISDANAATGQTLAALRELSRDLIRNNGWARRGVQAIVNNTVGWGIQPKAIGVEENLAALAVETWGDWANSTRCDYDGRMPFYGLEALVLQTVVISGEALVVRQPAGAAEELDIPLRVQVLEPDYLDSNRDGPVGGESTNQIIQGIEFDRAGRRVAYWLYKAHPGSSRSFGLGLESRRVLAENVLHIYRVERPGQSRGVPWLASAIARLNDYEDYEDAQLMQQKIAACFAAFVHDMDGAGADSPLGEADVEDDELETLEPGHVSYLPSGKDVTFATPPPVTDSAFTTRNLRRIAASLGVTYEDLTGDYSQVNFSSARMARLAHWANVHDWRWNMLIPQLCDGVWRWAMELAAGLNLWAETPTADWAPPPMPMLEPDKEGLAYQRLVRSGAMTLPQMIRERGEDPAAQLAEIAESNKELDRLGIVLDSDPRQTNTSGGKQTAAGGKTEPAAGDAEEPAEEPAEVVPISAVAAARANGHSNGHRPGARRVWGRFVRPLSS